MIIMVLKFVHDGVDDSDDGDVTVLSTVMVVIMMR